MSAPISFSTPSITQFQESSPTLFLATVIAIAGIAIAIFAQNILAVFAFSLLGILAISGSVSPEALESEKILEKIPEAAHLFQKNAKRFHREKKSLQNTLKTIEKSTKQLQAFENRLNDTSTHLLFLFRNENKQKALFSNCLRHIGNLQKKEISYRKFTKKITTLPKVDTRQSITKKTQNFIRNGLTKSRNLF